MLSNELFIPKSQSTVNTEEVIKGQFLNVELDPSTKHPIERPSSRPRSKASPRIDVNKGLIEEEQKEENPTA